MADKRYYIQSALKLDTREKTIQEERPLMNIRDNFQKIILVGSAQTPWHTEEGILVMGVLEFLSNPYAVEMSLQDRKTRHNDETRVTLAELLIVVAIIGVLVAVSIPVFTGQLKKAKAAADKANVRSTHPPHSVLSSELLSETV